MEIRGSTRADSYLFRVEMPSGIGGKSRHLSTRDSSSREVLAAKWPQAPRSRASRRLAALALGPALLLPRVDVVLLPAPRVLEADLGGGEER